LKLLSLCLLGIAALSAAPEKATFKGVITDDMCVRGDHSRMRMGPTDTECVKACIDTHGAMYILFDGEHAYGLSDQTRPAQFAGQRVAVVGMLDPKTNKIAVESISR
jgi:hypothetical protein